MILKSYVVEQNVEILRDYTATLIYGENNGIKDDVKEEIKKQNKDAEIINFFEGDVLKSNFLYESAAYQSLFTKKKILLIHEVTDRIFDQIVECLRIENKDIQIYILAGNLEKKSKLRSFFEKDKKLAIIPCYEDNERTLSNYISKEMVGYKGLTGEIINLIIDNSSMNRKIIKSEIIKIKHFFDQKKIKTNQILEILNIKSDSKFDKIRDNALLGEKKIINKLLSETEILREEAFLYLNSLNYRILKIQEILEICNHNNNYEEALEELKPPIFWKDKPIIIQQVKKWNLTNIEKVINKIYETEILMKKNSYILNDVVLKDFIIKLTSKASSTYS